MRDCDYYPPGAANDPNAPYNEPSDPEEIEVEVSVSETLSRDTTIYTDNYYIELDEEVVGDRENRFVLKTKKNIVSPETLTKEYYEQNYPILFMLQELKKLTEEKLHSSEVSQAGKVHYQKLYDSCLNWVEDDSDVCEN